MLANLGSLEQRSPCPVLNLKQDILATSWHLQSLIKGTYLIRTGYEEVRP